MIILKAMAKDVIDTARKRADAKNEPFTDQHQGATVLLEEIVECSRELKKMERNINRTMVYIFHDKNEMADKRIRKLRGYAVNLIAEAAQVAAMCDKFNDIYQRSTTLNSREDR